MPPPGDPETLDPPLPPPPEVIAFKAMIDSNSKRQPSASQQKFVKRMDSIPSVALPEEETCKAALNLAEKGLIGQFTGLWPSPKSVEEWTQRNWKSLIKEGIKSYFVGKGFFVFVFESAEDRSLIFRNGPYFMGPQGLYLNKWSPDFDPAQDVPSVVPVWVRLPHLPLHCWNPKSLQIIGNGLGKYIDHAARKDQYSCARICVEVDLEEGLPEAIKLTVAGWTHVQELDYEQLPFKCRHCHGYGHFAKHCKKKVEEQSDNQNGEQWTLIQKTNNKKKSKGKGISKEVPSSSNPIQEKSSNNKESRQIKPTTTAPENLDQSAPPNSNKENEEMAHLEVPQGSPSNPSYADVTRKKPAESSDSSEEENYEQPTRKVGRKSRREAREEEAERLKTQGSQPTIEMSIGRNSRNRPPKGGSHPTPGK
jgi:hypothetical protein